jgi:AcrR family transcriptional regulator
LDSRRAALLDAAESAFLRNGFHAATMDDIADAAGMSKKTVYQVFPTKAALFDSLLQDRLTTVDLPIDGDDRAIDEILIEFLKRTAEIALSGQQLGLVRLLIAEGPRSPVVGTAMQRKGSWRTMSVLERWLAEKRGAGRLRSLDPPEAAHFLIGSAISLPILSRLLDAVPLLDEAAIDRHIRAVVRYFMIAHG